MGVHSAFFVPSDLDLLPFTFGLDIQTRTTVEQNVFLVNLAFSRSRDIHKQKKTKNKLECGLMPNVMVALPNIGGALCSTPQSLADAHY